MPKRKSDLESLNLQERDITLLRGLLESRAMTSAHIAAIHFQGKRDYTKKRLQQLKAAGYLKARERRVTEPAILFLTSKAFTFLRKLGVMDQYPNLSCAALEKRACVSDLTIRHELEVMDVKAAWHEAIRGAKRFSIAEFGTWPLLYQFEARRTGYGGAKVLVKPDGFIRIHERETDGGVSEHTFFLEVDRSTETQDTLVSRAGCHLDFYKSGAFAVRCGAPATAFKDYPFRVLIVCKNAERRNNTAERLLQQTPPILTHVCLTTLAEVLAGPQDAIWIRPVDYRDAVKGSGFEAGLRQPTRGYRRQTGRDLLVERAINRLRLLESQ